jgi:predicted lipoprotein with Yx(FWY)xxD motif
MRNRWWAAAGLAAAAVVLAACGSTASSSSGAGSGSSSPAVSSGTGIKTMSTSKGMVLTNSAGLTLYWFAIDSSSKSNCNGACATFWPPLKGTAKAAGASLPGKFGTITRADGSTQATYDGHPLYTFKQDTAPGQINGNGLNLSGGLWWAETPSGAKLAAAPKSSSSSSPSPSSGGYGY